MELGNLVAEVKRAPSIIIILAGVMLVGGGVALAGVNKAGAAICAGFGLLVIWAGAVIVRTPVRIYERGVARGRTRVAYDKLRFIHDGNLGIRRGHIPHSHGMGTLARLTETDLILGDGRWNGLMKVNRTAAVDEMLQQRALPAAVAAWRARLAAGESYKVPQTLIELKTDELWVGRNRQPILIPLRELQIRGNAAYRVGHPEPVGVEVAFARDLLLRALLASYDIAVA
jgi:hypothetical protein